MKVVVIGNGIGGFSVASTIRHLDDRCDVTIISSEKTPLYSACALPDYISGEISREHVFVKSAQDYERAGIHSLFGFEVKEIDPVARKVRMDDGASLSFDKLVLATGSEAIIPGDRKKGVFKLKTLKDADDILNHGGKKAVVVGAGPIGIEIGIALQSSGYEVAIVEMMDNVLPLGLDEKGAGKVKAILKEHGITVFNSERSEKILGKDQVEGIVTNKREMECDTLVWAVGMRPRTELAKQAGIAIESRGGIRVNSRMETNLPGIFACGDCVESNDILTGEPYPSLFWHNANRQGAVAARNCLGSSVEYPGSQSILNVDVFGNHVAGFGFTEAALHRFQGIKALNGRLANISVVEKEENRSYYRLVLLDDRLYGGQFINVESGLGLLWSLMFRKKSMKDIVKILNDKNQLMHRPWLRPIRPFFM